MAFPCLSDCHTHTLCSPDGNDSAAMMCQAAERAGLHAIAITDHCECNDYFKDGYHQSVPRSYLEARQAAVRCESRIRIYAGIELGQPMQSLSVAQSILSGADYDFVLGSVHNIRGKEDFYFLDYRQENIYALLDSYLDELLEMVEWGGFDSLAHLTYPLRYIVGEAGIPVDLGRYDYKVDKILKRLAEKEKALEVNTSGLRQKIGMTLPSLHLVRRFREHGGKYVTIGSDSHRWKDVGAGIEAGLQVIQEAGFTHYTVYEKRSPKLISLT